MAPRKARRSHTSKAPKKMNMRSKLEPKAIEDDQAPQVAATESTEETSSKLTFFDLPQEVRDMIWRLVVVRDHPIVPCKSWAGQPHAHRSGKMPNDPVDHTPEAFWPLALSQTFKSFRGESLAVYFSENVFDLGYHFTMIAPNKKGAERTTAEIEDLWRRHPMNDRLKLITSIKVTLYLVAQPVSPFRLSVRRQKKGTITFQLQGEDPAHIGRSSSGGMVDYYFCALKHMLSDGDERGKDILAVLLEVNRHFPRNAVSLVRCKSCEKPKLCGLGKKEAGFRWLGWYVEKERKGQNFEMQVFEWYTG